MGSIFMLSGFFNPSVTSSLFVISVSLKCSFILLTALLLVRIMKRSSSASRHLVCSIALAGVLFLPVFSLIMPVWHVSIFPNYIPLMNSAATFSKDRMDVSQKARYASLDSAERPIQDIEKENSTFTNSALDGTDDPIRDSGSYRFMTRLLRSWPGLFFGIWIMGSAYILLRYLIGRICIWRATRQAVTVSDRAFMKTASAIMARFELTRPVRILKSSEIHMPLTWGLMRPKILLPADIEDWPAEHRQIVLLHEVAHVKQLDCLTQMLMQLAKALHWFNPFIWIFYHQFLKERECACDDFVLKEGQKASDYAKLLLDIAVKTPPLRFSSLTTVAMAKRSQLEGRLLAILNPKRSRCKINRLVVAIASVTAFALVLPLAAIHPKMPMEAAVQTKIPTQHAIGDKSSPSRSAEAGEDPGKEKSGLLTAGEMNDETAVPLQKIESNLTDQERPEQTSSKEHSDRIVLQSLFEALKDKDREVRIGAAETLGRMKKSEAIQPLTSALKDENWQVRMAAVEALGNIGMNNAVEPLLRALEDTHWQVRCEAAESLGDMEDKRAVKPLEQLVTDENRKVRMAAIQALGDIEDPGSVQSLIKAFGDADWEIREAAASALKNIESPESFSLFVSALRDDRIQIRLIAMEALGELKDKRAIQPLIEATGDDHWEIRKYAVDALVEVEDPSVVPLIGSLVTDPRLEVRTTAVYALGELEDSGGVPYLIEALKDSDWEVRKGASEALGNSKDASAVDALCQSLQDTNREVRKSAAESLGEIKDPRAVKPLTALLKDTEWEVREAAVRALGDLGGSAAAFELNRVLKDQNPQVRKYAARALGEIGHSTSVDPLIEALNDRFWEVRQCAASSLGEIGDPRAAEYLSARMKDEIAEVRRAAAKALGELR